jgi:hypothetical protein
VHFLSMAAANSAEVERLALGAGMKKGGAAKGELVLAMYELANCFRNGWGIKKDAAAAKHYYETAANLGDTDAMNEVAWCYIEGFGTKKDKVRSKCVCQPGRQSTRPRFHMPAGALLRCVVACCCALLIACPCHAPACLRHGRGLFSLICWAALWQTAMTAGMMMAMMMMMMPIPMMVVVVMVLQAVLTRACSSRRLSSCAWQSPRATRHWGTHGKFSFLFFSFPSPSSLVCV